MCYSNTLRQVYAFFMPQQSLYILYKCLLAISAGYYFPEIVVNSVSSSKLAYYPKFLAISNQYRKIKGIMLIEAGVLSHI